MLTCKGCGGALEVTVETCPACGAPVELGRLTGILGVVCRSCDAYNEPGAKACAACGEPLGAGAPAPAPEPAAAAPPAPAPAHAPTPAVHVPAAAPPPDAPVIRSFPRGGGPATRFVAPPRVPTAERPALTPIPLVVRCPRCGDEAGAGQFCARCGQPLGARGTQVLQRGGAHRDGPPVDGAVAAGRAKLVLERGEGAEGTAYRLGAEIVEAGRTRGAVSFPADPCLAAHHATFLYREGTLVVKDEGAPGGVFLRVRGLTVPLKPGDVFAVGDLLLRLAGPLPAPPPPPPDGTRRLGSPRPPGIAIAVEEWLEGAVAGRVFVRGGPSITIGRAGCAVSLGDDATLSQAHAELLVGPDGAVRLRDLGSSNGTYVRIPPHAERELRDGDFVRMGREVLRVAFA